MTTQEIIENNKLIAEFRGFGYNIHFDGKKIDIIGKDGKFLKLHKNRNGYFNVNCYRSGEKKTFLLHRLVASAYLPNPKDLPEVNHKDGDKTNNLPSNLEWIDRSGNMKHGIEKGLIPKSMVSRTGKKHWKSKVVQLFIRLHPNDKWELISEFESTGDAERKTGYNRKSIQDACKGRLKTYKGFKWKYK